MTAAPSIVLTGFEPFNGESVNPSWEVARMLDGMVCDGATVHAVQLPCVFGRAIERLDAALAQWRPQLVVALGLAGGRRELTPERIAINVDDARIPDNVKAQPIDTEVIAGGPAAYFSTLPIKAIVRDLHAVNLLATVSNSAGTFVCNHVFYALMHRLATRPELRGARGGFIHLPYLPEQSRRFPGTPGMALETQTKGIRMALRTAWRVREDVRESGGQLS